MRKMKLLIVALMVSCMMLTAVACSDVEEETDTPNTQMQTGDNGVAGDAARDVGDAAKDVGEDVVNGAKDVGEGVVDGVKDAGKDVKDGVEDMGKDIDDRNQDNPNVNDVTNGK